MSHEGTKIKVDTQPTKEVVVSSLTRDATIEECIFDLIDNAIDAARGRIQAKGRVALDGFGLPASYQGFHALLKIGGNGVTIEDNCGGISVETLKRMVLRFGQRSAHEKGIGIFGVGLNRALFKLGKVSHLKTDTGRKRSELLLNTDDYVNSKDWDLPAYTFSTTGQVGTTIEITSPTEDISNRLSDPIFIDELINDASRRYFPFLQKSFKITINDIDVPPTSVPLRQDSPYPKLTKFFKTKDGVSIFIEAGQHVDHRFSAEDGYSYKDNRLLAKKKQYGWSILCNDRLIIMSDTTSRTGWEKKWHSEFNGFVGCVRFICNDPSKLPWNTTKTDVDLNNSAYKMALSDMKRFVEEWRKNGYDAKEAKKAGVQLPPRPGNPAPGQGGESKKPTKPRAKPAIVKKPIVKEDHNQFTTVLPQDIDERFCFDKHLTLVHEGKALDMLQCSYSGLALIRMLLEVSAITYLIRIKRYGDAINHCFEARIQKKPELTEEDKKKIVPSLDELLNFFANAKDIWGIQKANYLKHSLKKIIGYKPTLNSAVHQPLQPINLRTAFDIRDEALAMLRHLIEYGGEG